MADVAKEESSYSPGKRMTVKLSGKDRDVRAKERIQRVIFASGSMQHQMKRYQLCCCQSGGGIVSSERFGVHHRSGGHREK